MLSVRNLNAFYGKSHVLHGVNFDISPGEIVALLGRNGSGRSTTAKAIMGLLDARGQIQWRGQTLLGVPTHRIAQLGLGYVPENRDVFARLTVEENLLLGAFRPLAREHLANNLDFAFEAFPLLKERRKQLAGSMSGGQQQMLAIARALMSSPRVLLVDEPSVGLSPLLVSQTITKLKELKDKYQLTVLMAEQNFNQAIRIADHGYIIVHGEIVFQGDVDSIKNNEMVKSFYLGVVAH